MLESEVFQTEVEEKIKIHISCSIFFNPAVYEIMYKDTIGKYREQKIIKYDACALHAGYLRLQTHSEYVILIVVPLKQWLCEGTSILRYMYIARIKEPGVSTPY
jgi:hypothetical protein